MILKIADEIVKHNHLLGKFSRTEAMGLTGDNLSNATLLPSFDLVLGPEAASWCLILSKITISIHDHLLKQWWYHLINMTIIFEDVQCRSIALVFISATSSTSSPAGLILGTIVATRPQFFTEWWDRFNEFHGFTYDHGIDITHELHFKVVFPMVILRPLGPHRVEDSLACALLVLVSYPKKSEASMYQNWTNFAIHIFCTVIDWNRQNFTTFIGCMVSSFWCLI